MATKNGTEASPVVHFSVSSPSYRRYGGSFRKRYDIGCSACYAGQLAVLQLAARGGLIFGVHSRILILWSS